MAQSQSDKQVLIVDDDVEICMMLRFFLEDEGYNIQTAPNGQFALEELRKGLSPCIVLLDLNMPIMTGWEFRAEQKSDPTLAEIPVAIISADRSLAQTKSALDAVEYFRKPIDLDRLLGVLDTVCS